MHETSIDFSRLIVFILIALTLLSIFFSLEWVLLVFFMSNFRLDFLSYKRQKSSIDNFMRFAILAALVQKN